MKNDDYIKFWIESSDEDFATMQHLFQSKDYHWSLFLGHLVIEKLLKAVYLKNIDNNIIFTHDLLRLAQHAKIELTEFQEDYLDQITTFNINARYDNYKQQFRKKCSKEFTEKWIAIIVELRQWLISQL